jgi:hypothetical protein
LRDTLGRLFLFFPPTLFFVALPEGTVRWLVRIEGYVGLLSPLFESFLVFSSEMTTIPRRGEILFRKK